MADNDIPRKRRELINAYPNSIVWKDKVKHMNDAQVVAVYLRLKRQHKVA
jgi:hypothetical protein